MRESSMIERRIEKEILWMKFDLKEVDGQTVHLNLSLCRFLEGIHFFAT
jgi:hypothetical protein